MFENNICAMFGRVRFSDFGFYQSQLDSSQEKHIGLALEQRLDWQETDYHRMRVLMLFFTAFYI